jgi:hypothetical protein
MLSLFPDDSGELPDSNTGSHIRLLAQSPLKLYLYWYYARHSPETQARNACVESPHCWEAVKLVDLTSDDYIFHGPSPMCAQWFDVKPERVYRADVGLIDLSGVFSSLLSSEQVRTPRTYLAPAPSIMPYSPASAWDYARMLNEMGYISYALEVFLEAADSVRPKTTQSIALEYSGVNVSAVADHELADMRHLLVAIALESHYEDLLKEVFSVSSLRNWLTGTWLKQSGIDPANDFNAARLRETFHRRLGIEINRIPIDSVDRMAMGQATQTTAGSGYVNMPCQAFHVWMPSMALSPATHAAFSLRL